MTSTRTLALAATAAALAGCGSDVAGLETEVTPSATSGTIVYSKELKSGFQLFTIAPDGSGERQITHVDGDAVNADWSPDGSRIVFEYGHKNAKPEYCSIAIVNADGSGLTDLANRRRGCDGTASFTPDGRIIFTSYDDKRDVEKITVMEADGSNRKTIPTPWRTGSVDPNVSPDGRWISFMHLRSEKRQALYLMRPDGSRRHRITPYKWIVAFNHSWSPDGRLIALTTDGEALGKPSNLLTIRPDGTHVNRITRFTSGDRNAFAGSFSPDGKQIVLRLENGGKGALAVVPRAGGTPKRITKPSALLPRFIDWGP